MVMGMPQFQRCMTGEARDRTVEGTPYVVEGVPWPCRDAARVELA